MMDLWFGLEPVRKIATSHPARFVLNDSGHDRDGSGRMQRSVAPLPSAGWSSWGCPFKVTAGDAVERVRPFPPGRDTVTADTAERIVAEIDRSQLEPVALLSGRRDCRRRRA